MSLSQPVPFAVGGAHLDRATHLREATTRLLRDPNAQLLPHWQGKLMFALGDGWPQLGWVPPLAKTLGDLAESPVLLGLVDEIPCFAADFSHIERARLESRFIAGAKFIDLRSVAGEIGAAEATIAATAKGVLGWHATHRFCACCGAPSAPEEGGWRRRCTEAECRALHFPRIDPVVIMLVLRGDRVLLGRQYEWPERLFSLLAGFMEPGESIEDAVRRETMEEAGIEIGRVRYLANQPWPFPSALMLGCMAEALNSEIAVDTQELEDAVWVNRSDIPDILAGKHINYAAPRLDAIARVLIASWVAGELPEFD